MPIRSFRRNNKSTRKPSLVGRLTSWRRTYYSETDIPVPVETKPNPDENAVGEDGFFSRYDVNISEIRSLPADLAFEKHFADPIDDEEEEIVKLRGFDEIAGRSRKPVGSTKAVHWAPDNRTTMDNPSEKKNLSVARKQKTDRLLRKTNIHVSTIPEADAADLVTSVKESVKVDEIPKISVAETTPVESHEQASLVKTIEAKPVSEPEKAASIDLTVVLDFVTSLFALPLASFGGGSSGGAKMEPRQPHYDVVVPPGNEETPQSRQSSFTSSWSTYFQPSYQKTYQAPSITKPQRVQNDNDDMSDSPHNRDTADSLPALCDVSSSSNEVPSVEEEQRKTTTKKKKKKKKALPERWSIKDARQVSMNESLSSIDSDEESMEVVLKRFKTMGLKPKKPFSQEDDQGDDDTVEDAGCMNRWERRAKHYHRSGCKDVSPLDEITQALEDCSYFLRCGAKGIKKTAFSAVAMPNFVDVEKEDESGTETNDDSSADPSNPVPFIIDSASPSRCRNNSF